MVMVVAVPLPASLYSSTKSNFYSHSPKFRAVQLQPKAAFINDSDYFQVGRSIGSYGFINITSASPSGPVTGNSFGDLGGLRTQDVEEGSVKIRLYEGRVSQGPFRDTPVLFKVYPGRRAGGVVADMMAANELNSHMSLQNTSEGFSQHLMLLVGGFETNTGEQWLAFRDYGKYSAADYAKIASEKVPKLSSWNSFERGQAIKRRQRFIIKLLQGAIRGLAYLHNQDRLHQSLGPFSVVLNTISESEAPYLIPRLRDLAFSASVRYLELEDSGPLAEGLWARASRAGAFTYLEKRAFGIADDIYEAGFLLAYLAFVPFCEPGVMDGISLQRLLENTFRLDIEATREYCIADDNLANAVEFLDLDNGAGWELLQCELRWAHLWLVSTGFGIGYGFTTYLAMLNVNFRNRPTAEAVLNHRFMTGAIL